MCVCGGGGVGGGGGFTGSVGGGMRAVWWLLLCVFSYSLEELMYDIVSGVRELVWLII